MRIAAIARAFVALTASAAALSAGAQPQPQTQPQPQSQSQSQSDRVGRTPGGSATDPAELAWGAATQPIVRDRLASELIGTRVRNWKGADLGKIEELVIDVNNARVHYAVLAFEEGGLFDANNKLFAYPVTLLRQGTGDELILNVPQEALERAPGFERSRWPDWDDRIYGESVDRYFGPKVAVQPQPNQRLRRASELLGSEVEDDRGRLVGEIRDIVADLGNARVRYAVIDFPSSWGPADKLLALPMQSFAVSPRDEDSLMLRVPRERLDLSRAFDEERWPNFEDKAYRSGIDGFPGGAPAAAPQGVEGRR